MLEENILKELVEEGLKIKNNEKSEEQRKLSKIFSFFLGSIGLNVLLSVVIVSLKLFGINSQYINSIFLFVGIMLIFVMLVVNSFVGFSQTFKAFKNRKNIKDYNDVEGIEKKLIKYDTETLIKLSEYIIKENKLHYDHILDDYLIPLLIKRKNEEKGKSIHSNEINRRKDILIKEKEKIMITNG